MSTVGQDRLTIALAQRRSQYRGLARHEATTAPLAPAQFGLWYHQHHNPNDAVHHRTTAFEIDGELDIDRLTAALNIVISRHEPLRTIYPIVDDAPVQIVLADAQLGIHITASQQPFNDTNGNRDALEQALADADTHPFFVATEVPLQAQLFVRSPTRHVLILAVSHLAVDGPSEQLLLDELTEAYRGETLPALERNYRDWAAWRDNDAHTDQAQSELDWWVAQHLRPLPPVQIPPEWIVAGRRADAAIDLTQTTCDALRALARAEGVTPFAVALTALGEMFRDPAGNCEIGVAIPFDRRDLAETNGLIGCFVETLPLRLDVRSGRSPRDLIRNTHAQVSAAHDHRATTMSQIIDALRSRTQRHTLIDSTISAQWRRIDDRRRTADKITMRAIPRPPLGPGIHLRIDETRDGITLRLGSRTMNERDHHRWLDAPRVLDQLHRSLLALLQAPDRTAAQPALGFQSIVERMQQHVDDDPRHLAVATSAQEFTRLEFLHRIHRVAAALHARGVTPGDYITIEAGGIDGITALHAGWRLGAVCVPIEASSPQRYKDRIATLAAPRAIVSGIGELLAECLDPSGFVPVTTDPSAPALLLFTSGSSGEPSGVMLHRGAIESYVNAAIERYALVVDDRVAQIHSLAFDAALVESMAAPAAGATIVGQPANINGSVRRFISELEHFNATVVDLPTALWHEVSDQVDIDHLAAPPHLRLALVGGQAMRAEYVTAWQRNWPGIELVNAYGPTEVTVEITTINLTHIAVDNEVPIGHAIPNTQVELIDDGGEGRRVEGAGIGELWVSSPQRALGYLANEDLTTARFVAGFGPLAGRCWYRTGDIVRRDDDDMLWFIARTDSQLKVRGFRVEPSQVEALLVEHKAVREAVVLLDDDALIAHVLCDGDSPSRDDLLRHVGDHLPAYSVPTMYVLHNHFPRTPGGKPDRIELARHHREVTHTPAVDDGDVHDTPMLAIWREVLDRPTLREDDDFFNSGGSSLRAIRLISTLERALQLPIPLGLLIEAPTVKMMRAALATQESGQTSSAQRELRHLVSLSTGPREPRLFLIPPGGGELIAYHSLARHFSGDRTITSFALPGLDGTTSPLMGLGVITNWYADRICATQPTGPYLVAGYSLSSFLAVEVARELQRRGAAVAAVFMIDPNVRIRFRALRRWFDGSRNIPLRAILLAGFRRRIDRLRVIKAAPHLVNNAHRTAAESMDLIWHCVLAAFREWRPEQFDIPVVVFRATGTPTHALPVPSPEPMSAFAATITVVTTPGMHAGDASLFTGGYVDTFARRLSEAIEAVVP